MESNVSLRAYNTLGVDCRCARYAEVSDRRDLQELYEAGFLGPRAKMPVFFLGGGSNTLFLEDFEGLVVRLCADGEQVVKQEDGRVQVRVEAGVVWEDFVKRTVERGWWGLENLSGIPGTVGGAVVQNMGAYGTEICQCIGTVEVFDTESGEFLSVPVSECAYSYRHSRFKRQSRYVVWAVVLHLRTEALPNLSYKALNEAFAGHVPTHPQPIADFVVALRAQKLPDVKRLGSAGSFFTNPEVSAETFAALQEKYPDMPGHTVEGGVKLSAAWLIDRCGWKGYRCGGAGVYEKQPLVLVNAGQASGGGIWELARHIRESVYDKFGVDIEPEVCVVRAHGMQTQVSDPEEAAYREVLEKMFRSLPMFQRVGAAAYKPDLNNTVRLMKALGEPYTKFRSVHVAGTNGKGSCSHMLASVLMAAGYKTGLYTSPHLRDFRERIKINGEMIPRAEVVEFYRTHEDLFTRERTSFFEMTVAMAFDYFARHQVDVAVIEVGMGGRLDSTNVITPLLSLITNISPDHMQFLGDTLPKIAGEKAGIIKAGVPVVIGESQEEVREVFERKAAGCGAPLCYADRVFSLRNIGNEGTAFTFDAYKNGALYGSGWRCDLAGGTYEGKNVVSVLAAVDSLRKTFTIPDEALAEGLARAAESTGLAGRWQRLASAPLTYCDTGHNEGGIRLVLEQIARTPHRRLHIVWGMVGDKDIAHILALLPKDAAYYFCQAPQQRALDVHVLQRKAEENGLRGEAFPTVRQALTQARSLAAPDDLIYIGGSTFVVAEVV